MSPLCNQQLSLRLHRDTYYQLFVHRDLFNNSWTAMSTSSLKHRCRNRINHYNGFLWILYKNRDDLKLNESSSNSVHDFVIYASNILNWLEGPTKKKRDHLVPTQRSRQGLAIFHFSKHSQINYCRPPMNLQCKNSSMQTNECWRPGAILEVVFADFELKADGHNTCDVKQLE